MIVRVCARKREGFPSPSNQGVYGRMRDRVDGCVPSCV